MLERAIDTIIRKDIVELVCDKCSKRWCVRFRKERHSGAHQCRSCANRANNLKHGCDATPLYYVWTGMRARCRDSKKRSWANYGGRGIRVCTEWNESFTPFRDWALAHGYADGLQIDRENNDGHYAPDNCRFVPAQINMQNRRSTVMPAEDVAEMKAFHAAGVAIGELARAFKTSHSYVWSICKGKRWGNIPPADYLCLPC